MTIILLLYYVHIECQRLLIFVHMKTSLYFLKYVHTVREIELAFAIMHRLCVDYTCDHVFTCVCVCVLVCKSIFVGMRT